MTQDQQDQDARKLANRYASDLYGDKAQVTQLEGPHEIINYGPPDQLERITWAWVASVNVPDRGSAKVTVLRGAQGWYAFEVERPAKAQ